MRIVCPNCGFSKEVQEDRIPEKARAARCPKCSVTFALSRVKPEPPPPAVEAFPEESEVSPEISEVGLGPAPVGEAGTETNAGVTFAEDHFSSISGDREEAGKECGDEGAEELGRGVEDHGGSIPWEEPSDGNIFLSLLKTIRQSLFSPARFFERVAPGGVFGYPVSYGLLLSFLGVFVQMMWNLILNRDTVEGALAFLNITPHEASVTFLFLAAVGVPVLILFLVVSLFVEAAVVHVCLAILRGARAPFVGTLKVTCYSCSVYVFMFIPFVGVPLVTVWGIVLKVMGISRVHRIGTGKAILALLLPVIIAVLVSATIAAALSLSA